MSAMTVTIGGDLSSLRKAMAGAAAIVSASANKMSQISGAGLAGIGRGGAAALAKGFDLAAVGLKTGIGAALAGGAAAMGAGVKAVNSAANFESTKVAFATLIGDAAKAEEILAKLRQLGAETPFEFPDLADAGRKLIAFGESADTVPETLRRIGDVSAGVQAPVGEIAELYGKARVQGRLFAEDINQLTGRGIPIIQELARQFGVSDSQVKKLVETGQVGFPNIERAFISMTSQGGKFAGMMAAQSKTTSGLFSTLKDSFNEVFLALGTPINDAIRPLVADAIAMVGKLTPMAVAAGQGIKNALQFVMAAFQSGQVLNLVATSLKLAFATAVNSLINGFRAAVSFLFYFITDGSAWKSLGSVLLGLAGSFGIALLNAFEMPITYLKAGIEWVVAHMLKGLAKIPGMSEVMGFEAQDVNTNFGDLVKANKSDALFGIKYEDLQKEATDLLAGGAAKIAESAATAASKAAAFGFADTFDTSGLKDELRKLVDTIKETIPKPTDEKKGDAKSAPVAPAAPPVPIAKTYFEPVVTSLAKVGGGGYASNTGMIDAQRENNKLTTETNRLLEETNRRLDKLGGSKAAAFG